jgi:biopolymer transport protein ExbD
MAGVDTGERIGRRRATNGDINMIPFIDLLMVTIAFLLITAVWATNSRLSANTEVPGTEGCSGDCNTHPEKRLHVQVDASSFHLTWKQGATVLSDVNIPKQPILIGDGSSAALRYPDLAHAIQDEWTRAGGHRDPADRAVDQAVLHTDDRLPFREMAAVLDAIEAPKRNLKLPSGGIMKIAAFNPVLSSK